jgi:hypothetical protein
MLIYVIKFHLRRLKMKKAKRPHQKKPKLLKQSPFDPRGLLIFALALLVTGLVSWHYIFAAGEAIYGERVLTGSHAMLRGGKVQVVPLSGAIQSSTANPYYIPTGAAQYDFYAYHFPQYLVRGFTVCYSNTGCHDDSNIMPGADLGDHRGITVVVPTDGYLDIFAHYDYFPISPANQTLQTTGANSFQVSWASSCSVKTYDIYLGNTRVASYAGQYNGTAACTGNLEALNYSYSGLKCGTTYDSNITASNPTGETATTTVKYTTPACPPSPTPSSPSSSGSKTTASKPTAPVAKPGSSSDKQPPSSPSNLKASPQDNTVELDWDASTDNVGVVGYVVERSTDKITWQKIENSVATTSYTDNDVHFNTQYYYRVSAYDASGNVSTPALTNIVTSSFQTNVSKDKDSTITSSDGLVSAKILAGTFDIDAECSLDDGIDPGLLTKQQKLLAGAYQLNCADSNGIHLLDLSKPVTYTIHRKGKLQKAKLLVQVSKNDAWAPIALSKAHEPAFSSDQPDQFIILKAKSTNWLAVIFVIFLLIGMFALLFGLISWYRRRRAEDDYNSYASDGGSESEVEELTGYNDSHKKQ